MKHLLSLEVPDTGNSTIFRITDTSFYAENFPITCGLLQITTPGFKVPVQIEVEKKFNLVLTACKLGIQLNNCLSTLENIPDGLYKIKYTVAPANLVYVEYNYLRVTQTLDNYYKALAELELKGCEPEECVRENLKHFRLIKSFIDAAKAKVEYGTHCSDGIALLIYAQNKLKSYAKGCCK